MIFLNSNPRENDKIVLEIMIFATGILNIEYQISNI
jgi:hypothetical protein